IVVEIEADKIDLRKREVGWHNVVRQETRELHNNAVGGQEASRAAGWIAIISPELVGCAEFYQTHPNSVQGNAIAHGRDRKSKIDSTRAAANVVHLAIFDVDVEDVGAIAKASYAHIIVRCWAVDAVKLAIENRDVLDAARAWKASQQNMKTLRSLAARGSRRLEIGDVADVAALDGEPAPACRTIIADAYPGARHVREITAADNQILNDDARHFLDVADASCVVPK